MRWACDTRLCAEPEGAELESRPPRKSTSHGRRTADLARCSYLNGSFVGPEHDLGIEQRNQRVEVTFARGSQEGSDHLALAGGIGAGNRRRSLYPLVGECAPQPAKAPR